MFPDSLAPKDLVFTIDENNADIGTVAFTIKHGHPHRIQYNYSRLYVSVATFNYARIYLPSQYAERSPLGSRSRQPPADDPGRHDPQIGGRDLHLSAAGLEGHAQNRSHRPRRDERRRRHRAADARGAAGRALAAIRPLGAIRPRIAADQGPPSTRFRAAADLSRSHHRYRPQ